MSGASEGFNVYLSSRPVAVPLGSTDMVLLFQNGKLTLMSPSTIAIVKTILIDTSAGPASFQLPATGIIRYLKDDASGFAATFTPQVAGQTIMRSALPFEWDAVQDETITFQLIGSNWYRVG